MGPPALIAVAAIGAGTAAGVGAGIAADSLNRPRYRSRYITETYVSQTTQIQLQQAERKAARNRRRLQELKKPKQTEQKFFLDYLDSLQTFDYYNPIPRYKGIRNVGIIGKCSAGKSALLNYILEIYLPTGVDDTTEQFTKVHVDRQKKLAYFDSQGLNDHVSIINHKIFKAFASLDYVFIATAVTFKEVKKAIDVMNKIDPPRLFLVRTKCDLFPSEFEFQQARKKDVKLLKEWGINHQVLYVSSKRSIFYRDNAKLKELMTN